MTFHRNAISLIARAGREATVYARSKQSVNEFNNTEWEFTESGTVLCVRSYPNRNTEVQHSEGDRNRDVPVFFFPADTAPPSDARLGYPELHGGETLYELQAPTNWPTHVEIFGEVVNE